MNELLQIIATATTSELYEIANDLKRYATSRDIQRDDLKNAVDAIIAVYKRLEPYNRTSVEAIYKAHGL